MDNLTREQRSYCMSRVKGRDTAIERRVRSELHKRGFRYRKNVRSLPGAPDLVFPTIKLVIFVNGDFWHGYRFPTWENKLSRFWKKKIESTRLRDRRNRARLRTMGYRVITVWEHEIEKNVNFVTKRLVNHITTPAHVTRA